MFRKLYPDRVQYTYWDYFRNAFAHDWGWRIDHILAATPLAAVCHDREGRMALWAWTALALLLTLSMPAAVITVFFASAFRFPPWVSAFLLITLLALSLAAHLSIVFGGRLALEAKHYLGDALRCGYLRIRMTMTGARNTRMRRDTIDAFRGYSEPFTLLPDAEEFGPFDSMTRAVVNDTFGYEIISIPRGSVGGPSRGYLPRPGE